MKSKLVTVFGGGGFVGRYAVEALLKAGARVRIAERSPKNAWNAKALGDLGQLQFISADITRPETLASAVAGVDVVVNLVAILNSDLAKVNADGAENVAQAASRANVSALVHVSAIGANPESVSAYGRSKGDGEVAIMANFPSATILRPSIIFGREDRFINLFANMIRLLPIVPIIGATTKFQPVFVGDVARAIVAAVGEANAGKTFELGGARQMSMREINDWIARASDRKPFFLEIPNSVSGVMATLGGWLPAAPITRDQWLMLQSDNVVSVEALGLDALGVDVTPIEAVAPGWMVQYRKQGRFGRTSAK
jgi:uncharacterized protein YbjT (DUF2867 family)